VRVSQIYHEFESQLADWHEQYRDDPDREIVCLYLLALEREENVVVAYDDAVLGRRLASMRIPVGVQELMRYALARVQADEQMHVIDARTALLQLGTATVRVRKLVHQTAGAMGGWTASVRQHRRWSQAPVSRAAATLLLWAGRLTGRVPGTVRPHLDYLSFRDFCRYNMQTESTAWLCWQRLAELASHVSALSVSRVNDMRRVADDEDRHRRVFATLASALTGDDRLQDGASEEYLATRLGAIGRHFLPPLWADKAAPGLQGTDGADVDDAPENRAVANCQIGG
jgi:hypothetical protein